MTRKMTVVVGREAELGRVADRDCTTWNVMAYLCLRHGLTDWEALELVSKNKNMIERGQALCWSASKTGDAVWRNRVPGQ